MRMVGRNQGQVQIWGRENKFLPCGKEFQKGMNTGKYLE
jgi:hypothetical protein